MQDVGKNRDRPPRPMSAKPSIRPQRTIESGSTTFDITDVRCGGADEDDIDRDDLIQDDDGDDEENGNCDFEAEALAAQRRLMEKQHHSRAAVSVSSGSKFRPTSAPVHRSRPQSAHAHKSAGERQELERERAAMSVAYLKQANEKRKKREAEFARELLREETEYKKKMTQKIDQANRMSAASGSDRIFSLAPDRDGLHVVRISDPTTNERVISVENFLREFERLASIQIGQLQQRTAKSTNLHNQKTATQEPPPAKESKLRIHGIRTSRMGSSTSSLADLSANRESTQRPAVSNSKRLITKATDRALVQEELKSVLTSTIELTKVLQDQLHELKLKGWNFSSRTG